MKLFQRQHLILMSAAVVTGLGGGVPDRSREGWIGYCWNHRPGRFGFNDRWGACAGGSSRKQVGITPCKCFRSGVCLWCLVGFVAR
jgi:hypothetical protein